MFLGVNSNDNDDSAEEFLAEYPVPFPHYRDPNLEVAASVHASTTSSCVSDGRPDRSSHDRSSTRIVASSWADTGIT